MALITVVFAGFGAYARHPAKGGREPPYLLLFHSKNEGGKEKEEDSRRKRNRPEQKFQMVSRDACIVGKNRDHCQLTNLTIEC
jgi:hypothetical protein